MWLDAVPGRAQYADWKHSGSIWILTTPEGADLPATASVAEFALADKLKPGLVKYRTEFGSKQGDRESVLHMADNLVCGDAYFQVGNLLFHEAS